MILEYHKIDRPKDPLDTHAGEFRRDLQRLWEAGYRLSPSTTTSTAKISPAGRQVHARDPDLRRLSPGSFRYLDGRQGRLADRPGLRDRDSLEAFARTHPEFGRRRHVLCAAGRRSAEPALQPARPVTRKLTYLAANGYEIGNHTLWHAPT